MRSLDRERRWVLTARFLEKRPAEDAQGRLTGRHEAVYAHQVPVLATVSAAKGSAQAAVFGQDLAYDRTVVIDDPYFSVDEASVLWIDRLEQPRVEGWLEDRSPMVTGIDADGGTFDDYSSGDSLDEGEFSDIPVENGFPVFCEEPFDYTVKRVSRTGSYTVLAVSRVEVSA